MCNLSKNAENMVTIASAAAAVHHRASCVTVTVASIVKFAIVAARRTVRTSSCRAATANIPLSCRCLAVRTIVLMRIFCFCLQQLQLGLMLPAMLTVSYRMLHVLENPLSGRPAVLRERGSRIDQVLDSVTEATSITPRAGPGRDQLKETVTFSPHRMSRRFHE